MKMLSTPESTSLRVAALASCAVATSKRPAAVPVRCASAGPEKYSLGPGISPARMRCRSFLLIAEQSAVPTDSLARARRAEVAHGGDARLHGYARHRLHDRNELVGEFVLERAGVRFTDMKQVTVGFPQPRQHAHAVGVDDLRSGWHCERPLTSNGADAIAGDQDDGVLERRPAESVDEAPAYQGERNLRLGLRGLLCWLRCGGRDARQHYAGERRGTPEAQNDFRRLSEIERGQTRARRSGMLPLIAAAVWKSNG